MTYTEVEYDLLYHEPVGQSRKLRDGFTREQAGRMWARKNASGLAASTPYADGTSMKEVIDRMIAVGFTHIIRSGRWMYLSRADGVGDKPRLDSKIERNYIKVALNQGEFKRNY